MFPDFSAMGKSMDELNSKFDRIVSALEKQNALLERIAIMIENATPPMYKTKTQG